MANATSKSAACAASPVLCSRALAPARLPAVSWTPHCAFGGIQAGSACFQRGVAAVRRAPALQAASASAAAPAPTAAPTGLGSSSANATVVLTREAGKNGMLRKVLEAQGVVCLEMPLVETAAGPDRQRLVEVLQTQAAQFDWVCLTSPEAAKVFMEAWRAAGRPSVRIAVVGEGTGRVLIEEEGDALRPQFVPTVANAEHFGPELPQLEGGSNRVLYPSSSKASTELQGGLTKRGFDVLRLNTYDTLPVKAIEAALLDQARQAAVLTVASPSAIKAWMAISGSAPPDGMIIACIGSTSARAAEKLGLKHICYPEEPGVQSWADTIMQALQARGQ